MTDRTRATEEGRPGALVFATSYTGLGIVRSLGRHGIPVWVLASPSSLACRSRYATRSIDVDGLDEPAQIDLLVRLAREQGLRGSVLFPDGDRHVGVMARHHEILGEDYTTTVPPWDVVRWALDKRLLSRLAEEAGIDYPRTFFPESREDAEAIDGPFPMLLKPFSHESTDRFSVISGAWIAHGREQLLELYGQATEAMGGRSLIAVQELIPGDSAAGFGYAALCKEGVVVASISTRRVRLLPVDFGACACAETIEPIPEVEDAARRWIGAVGYTGLCDFDFKRHSGTGRYVLHDVNPRAWGWHPLGAYAGVDFPYLMWRMACGEDVATRSAQTGVRWVRTPYDAVAAMQLIGRGDLTWREYAASLRGAHHEMGQLDDLLPALFEVPLLFKLVGNKLQGR